MKKLAINFYINVIIIVLIVLGLSVKLYYLDRISTSGSELKEIELKINKLKLENESLSATFSEDTSLRVLKEVAIYKGYTTPQIIWERPQ